MIRLILSRISFTILLILLLGSCSSAAPVENDPSSEPQATTEPTVSESTAPTEASPSSAPPQVSETPGGAPESVEAQASDSPTESPEPTDVVEPEPGTDATPRRLGPQDAGRSLTLNDLGNREELKGIGFADDTFKLRNKPTSGIGGPVRACGDNEPIILDLRPAAQFSRLSFSLGLDVDRTRTDSTDQVIVAQVLGNESDVLATKRASIVGPASVEATIDGVVVAKIALFLDEQKCSYSNEVTAVVGSLQLQ